MNQQRRTSGRSSLALLLLVQIAVILAWPGLVVVRGSAPLVGPNGSRTPAALVRADGCWVQPGVGVACSVADASATPEVLR